MKHANVRSLRYGFSEIERLLQQGEEIEITKRKRALARLVPVRRAAARCPDFLARLRAIYGARRFKASGAQHVARERNRY